LSPGETLEADLAAPCLVGLNEIVNEISGAGSMLWRETLESSLTPITGITATLGTDWANVEPGDDLLGATYNPGSYDFPIAIITMQQYQDNIAIKTTSGGFPQYLAYDGQSTVFLYPGATGQTISLRIKRSITEFADLDTDYFMPQGWRGAMSAMLAERMSPSVLGAISPDVARAAMTARRGLLARGLKPAIISGDTPRGNIFNGWMP
jgi:hypothetical protein